jgi:hypothetical protein
MRPHWRSLCLNGVVLLAGAVFCAFAALDLYITRGTVSPSQAANREARMALRAHFWKQPAHEFDGQGLPASDRLEFYRILILRGAPVNVTEGDELSVQKYFARFIHTAEFRDLPRLARDQAVEWAGENLPNDEGIHVYGIPGLKIPSLEERAGRGDCGAARRLASYNMFGAQGKYDMELKWLRIAARCPGTNFKELLVGMYIEYGVQPKHAGEIEELIAAIEAIEPERAAIYRDMREARKQD